MGCKSHSWFFAHLIPENAGYLHQLDHRNRSISRHLGTCHTNVKLLLTAAFVFSPVLGNVNCCELPNGSPTAVLVLVSFLASSTMNEDARSSRGDGAHPFRTQCSWTYTVPNAQKTNTIAHPISRITYVSHPSRRVAGLSRDYFLILPRTRPGQEDCTVKLSTLFILFRGSLEGVWPFFCWTDRPRIW